MIQDVSVLSRMTCASDAMGLSAEIISFGVHSQRQPDSRNFQGLSAGVIAWNGDVSVDDRGCTQCSWLIPNRTKILFHVEFV